MIQEYDDEGPANRNWVQYYRIESMYPAPPIFPLSKKFPSDVERHLRLAFQLYWTDTSASASQLRTSLEIVLDNKGISRTGLDKKNNPYRLTLAARIDAFEKAMNDPENAESMNALRVVGNIGTHGDKVTDGDYFDLIDVYEDALLEIYENKSANLIAKKKSLIALI